MKKLFSVLLSGFGFCILHAQEKAAPLDTLKYFEQKKANTNFVYDWLLKNKVTEEQYKKILPPGFSITITGNTYQISDNTYNLPYRNKIITLPQDNTPCMVPDMKQFNMPVFKPKVPNTMPNAAINRNKLIGRR